MGIGPAAFVPRAGGPGQALADPHPRPYHQLGRPFEPDLLHAALAATRNLTAASSRPVLLHGDFHRGNVLASGRAGWLAIDPYPLVGDPESDIADQHYFAGSSLPAYDAGATALMIQRIPSFLR